MINPNPDKEVSAMIGEAAILEDLMFMPSPIAEAVNAIMAKVRGVAKAGRNKDQNYDYTRVEDLLGLIQPEMAEAGLLILPSEVGSQMLTERLLVVSYTFTLAHRSGAVWQSPMRFSGMATLIFKSGSADDKAWNKCGTAARKFFLLALFNIPTALPDSDRDGDKAPRIRKSAAQAKKDNDHEVILAEIWACKTESDLNEWYENFGARMAALPLSWAEPMRDKVEVRRNEILDEAAMASS